RVLSVDVLTRTIRLADGRILSVQTDALIDAGGDLTALADLATALAANADVTACVTTKVDLLGIATVASIRFDLENADQASGEVASVDPLTGTIVLDSGTRIRLLADADVSGDHGSLASIHAALAQGARIAVEAEGFLENDVLHARSVLCELL
ncbi:MAG TPA: hypothetical protein VJ788_09495, partial [Gemmatimonadota bacterium]|nr:hypothetical protein [Gemmatimonadota bacterium]